jgi:ribosomal protein L7/L12
MGAKVILVAAIVAAVVFVLGSLGRRKEEQLRNAGIYPPEGLETEADVDRLIQLGHKIEAIKVFRKIHAVGLKEAKEAVEQRQAEIGTK